MREDSVAVWRQRNREAHDHMHYNIFYDMHNTNIWKQYRHIIITSRMQASGERRRVLHRPPRLCIVPIH